MKLLRWAALAGGSAITAEFLLGDQYLTAQSSVAAQLGMLSLFICFYGSAAVLIREITRRMRLGWPTILLLALAFGVVEEGLLTQSLFNPDYLGAHQGVFGFIPALGIAGPWTIFVLTLHVVWSISTPIALAEAAFSPRRVSSAAVDQKPWFGRGALVVFAVLYVLCAAAIYVSSVSAIPAASPTQIAVIVVVVVALIVVALRLSQGRASTNASASHPVVAAGCAFLLLSLFHLSHKFGSPWVASGLMIALLVILAALVFWARLDPLGLAVGAILTYCWVGLRNAIEVAPWCVIEQSVIVLLVLLMLLALILVVRRRGRATSASVEQATIAATSQR